MSINPLFLYYLALTTPAIGTIAVWRIKPKEPMRFFWRFNALALLLLSGFVFAGFTLYQSYRSFTVSDYIFLIFGICIVVATLILILLKRRLLLSLNGFMFITALLYMFFLSEVIINSFVKHGYLKSLVTVDDGTMGAFNKPPVVPDTVKGYRWIDDSVRIFKAVHGNVVFDRTFKANNKGYISPNDYHYEKKPGVFRIIVLGDSYTAAEYIKVPWPERAEQLLQQNNDSLEVELYSFALDGTGIVNWHSIFFGEIAEHYEFDALIMAIYGDNLYRDFFMMYASSSDVFGSYFETKPLNFSDFENNYKPTMWPVGTIISDSLIDDGLKNEIFSSAHLKYNNKPYVLMRLHDLLRSAEYKWQRNNYINAMRHEDTIMDSGIQINQVIDNMGTKKWHMLSDIMNYCSKNNKQLLIASVPHEEVVRINNYRGGKSKTQVELESIAKHFGILYYDAFPLFQSLSDDSLRNSFLKNDAHWNQQGSDIFAKGIVGYLIKKRVIISDYQLLGR